MEYNSVCIYSCELSVRVQFEIKSMISDPKYISRSVERGNENGFTSHFVCETEMMRLRSEMTPIIQKMNYALSNRFDLEKKV